MRGETGHHWVGYFHPNVIVTAPVRPVRPFIPFISTTVPVDARKVACVGRGLFFAAVLVIVFVVALVIAGPPSSNLMGTGVFFQLTVGLLDDALRLMLMREGRKARKEERQGRKGGKGRKGKEEKEERKRKKTRRKGRE